MKSSALCLLASIMSTMIISTTAIGGTPEQDPIVRSLREKFAAARTPRIEDLKLEKTWRCKSFVAAANDFRVNDAAPRFATFDELVLRTDRPSGPAVEEYAYVDEALVGRVNNMGFLYYSFLRVTNDGDLMVELTIAQPHPFEVSPAVSNPSYGTAGYSTCPANLVEG